MTFCDTSHTQTITDTQTQTVNKNIMKMNIISFNKYRNGFVRFV